MPMLVPERKKRGIRYDFRNAIDVTESAPCLYDCEPDIAIV